MLKAERMDKIREYIVKNKYVNINDLAIHFNISTATVRRCLKQLEKENFVESVRGGAVLISDGNTFEQSYQVKRQQNIDEKKRIAEAACSFISSNNSIFLDSSSTVFEMTTILTSMKHITVLTNDVFIASALSPAKDIDVTVTGGTLRKTFYTLTGFLAERVLKDVSVDYAFMGIDAINSQGNFMITNTEEVTIKQIIAERANKVIVLCDHSKFNRQAFLSLWDNKHIHLVITGKELGDDEYKHYTDLGLNIQLV